MTLEEDINGMKGVVSGLAQTVLRHDCKVHQTVNEMRRRDTEGVYETFKEEHVPKRYRPFVGHYTREYDAVRSSRETGEHTDIFEFKTHHNAKAYVKAVEQLSYAHALHKGKVDTWYVSWRESDESRVVVPVWTRDDYDANKTLEQIYKPSNNRSKYNFKNVK